MRKTSFQRARARSDSVSSQGSSAASRPAPVRSFSPVSDDDIVIPTEPSTQEESRQPVLRQPTAFAWTGASLALSQSTNTSPFGTNVARPLSGFLQDTRTRSLDPSQERPRSPGVNKEGTREQGSSSEVRMGRPRTTRGFDPFEQQSFRVSSNTVQPPLSQPVVSQTVPNSTDIAPATLELHVTQAAHRTSNTVEEALPVGSVTSVTNPNPLHGASSLPTGDEETDYSDDEDSDFAELTVPSSSQTESQDTAALSLSAPQLGISQPSKHPPVQFSSNFSKPADALSASSRNASSTPPAHTVPDVQNTQSKPVTEPHKNPTTPQSTYVQYYPGGQYHGTLASYYQPTRTAQHSHYRQDSRPPISSHQARSTPNQPMYYNPAYYKRVHEDGLLNPGKPIQSHVVSPHASSHGETSTGRENYPSRPRSSTHQHNTPTSERARRSPTKSNSSTQQLTPSNGPPLRVVTLLLKDLRSNDDESDEEGDLQLVEVRIPIRDMDDKKGFWADSKDICQQLQSGPARVDGPAKVYARRQQYKQIVLRVSEDNKDAFMSANVIVSLSKTLELFIQPIMARPKKKEKPEKSRNHYWHVSSDIEDNREASMNTSERKRKRRSSSPDEPGSPPRPYHESKKARPSSRHNSPPRVSSPPLIILDDTRLITLPTADPGHRICKAIRNALTKNRAFSNMTWGNLDEDDLRQLIERYKVVNHCITQWCGQKTLSDIYGMKGEFNITKGHVYRALRLDDKWVECFEKTWPLYVAQAAGNGSRLADVDSSKFVDQPPKERLLSILQEADRLRTEGAPA